jgi:uncharacterized repeat protein (TIGR03803 family)
MRTFALSRYALSISAAAVLLAACGGSQVPIGAPGAMAHSSSSYSYNVIFRFGSAPGRRSRGREPSGLINVGGTFYGTTLEGGGHNDGTLYNLSPAGKDKILRRFHGGSDAEAPEGPLIDVRGTLYGTSFYGGGKTGGGCFTYGCGTVFSVTMTGMEKVLHAFTGYCQGCTDGANPVSGLIDVNGTLYGTTLGGGVGYPLYDCCGTIYRISKAGKYEVLYRFCKSGSSGSSCLDGSSPNAGLIDVNGTLYGATVGGGKHGAGTVFSISTSGKEKVLYSFTGGSDGLWPYGTLIDVNGRLYGTTYAGGSGNCLVNSQRAGCGTVYSVSFSGVHDVLYSFAGGSDGAFPHTSLANVNGSLFGITPVGGSGKCHFASSPGGCGTIYQVTTAGSESVVHSFTSGSDGAWPSAGLANVNGTLFGTTVYGGAENCRSDGCGTVFSLVP